MQLLLLKLNLRTKYIIKVLTVKFLRVCGVNIHIDDQYRVQLPIN